MPQPVPPDLLRMHLNFNLGSEEIAVATFHLRLDHSLGADTPWPQMCNVAADKLNRKWVTNVNNNGDWPAQLSLRDVACYHLDAATGKALDKGSSPATGAGKAWAGTGGASLPLECATAVSLYGYADGEFVSDRARRRGRMFLPPLAVSAMDASPTAGRMGRMSSAQATVLNQRMGAFFNDVHRMTVNPDPNTGGQAWDLVVVSRAGVFATVVKRIAVGDVIDSQRRRRNNQAERYFGTVVTND